MLVTQIPAVLFSRCPGCARPLAEGAKSCTHCKLAVTGPLTRWTQDRIETEKLRPHAFVAISAICAGVAGSAVLLAEPHRSTELTAAGVIFVLWCCTLAGLGAFPWSLVLLARLRKVTSWSYTTDWSSDVNAGFVHATVLLRDGKLAHARGSLSEHSQPSARQFGRSAAPLASQRRFVRWLTAETVVGRARVADERTIEWEINGPEPKRGVFARVATRPEPVRTETRRLMVAAAPSDLATETGANAPATVYSAHLGDPRPVSELWVALSREVQALPEPAVGDYEFPEWAHELEAALTAEVAALVVN